MTDSFNSFAPKDLSRITSDSFVASIQFHERLASTNDQGLLLAAKDDLPTPLLILAQEQTQGRGRGNNPWRTRPGALTFSLVIGGERFGLSSERGMAISLVTAIAVRDALADLHPTGDFVLKWPNDVYLGTAKIAGILLERSASRPSRLIVGIGINVNNAMSQVAHEFSQPATSLREATGKSHSLTGALQTVLTRLGWWYESFAADDVNWVSHWRRHCLLNGRHVRVLAGTRPVTGICGGIDPHGALLVQNETGTHTLISGTIEHFESTSPQR